MKNKTIFLPNHILIKIFSFLNQNENFLSICNDNNKLQSPSLHLPIHTKLKLISKTWGKLYWETFCMNQCFCIFLFRYGVYPLYKKSFDSPKEIIQYLLKKNIIDSKLNQMPSRYPMDFYFILRLKKEIKEIDKNLMNEYYNELVLFLQTETMDFDFDLINDIKSLYDGSGKKPFYFKGNINYFLDLY